MSKRLRLSKLIAGSGFLRLGSVLRANNIVILNYHRIKSADDKMIFDSGVYGHTTEEFYEHMSWIKKQCDVLSENELIDYVKSGKRSGKRVGVVVTFDDGYIDNYTQAFPILKNLEIPAIFFIPFNAIEQRELGWWDQISWMVDHTVIDRALVHGLQLDFSTADGKADSILELQRFCKQSSGERVADLMEILPPKLGVELPTSEQASAEMMSWEQLREVADNGIAIGSHTISHKILSKISRDQQAFEIGESKRKIEEKVGKSVRTIGYPVGGRDTFTPVSKELARESGYDLAFSFYSGFINGEAIDEFDMPRTVLSRESTLFKCEIIFPEVFLA